jgi:DNA-binding PadR family transcriptional regulator
MARDLLAYDLQGRIGGGIAMTAKDVLLGLIVERPGYGYGLKQRWREELASAGFAESIVYSSLTSLLDDGLIEAVAEPAGGAGRRRGRRNESYQATPEGVAHFDDWMGEATPLAPMRDELRIKLIFCKQRHVTPLTEIAWAQEQQCLDRLRELKSSEETVALRDCETLPQALEMLLLDAEVATLQERINWLRKFRQTLRRFADESGDPRDAGRHLRGL